MKITNPKDFWSGVLFLLVGAAFAIVSRNYSMGTGARMGPAYFPFYLGILLAVLGFVISLRGFKSTGEGIGHIAWKPVLLVTLAVILFGILLKPLGLLGAGIVLIVIASLPSGEFKLPEVLILGIVLVLMCAAIFVWGLKLPIPIIPEWASDMLRAARK